MAAGREKRLTFLHADIKLQSCCPLVSQWQKAHIVRELLPNQRRWCHASEIFLTLSMLWPSTREKNAEMITFIRRTESTVVTTVRLSSCFLFKQFMTDYVQSTPWILLNKKYLKFFFYAEVRGHTEGPPGQWGFLDIEIKMY